MDLSKFLEETDFEEVSKSNEKRQDELDKEAASVEVVNDCGDACKI
ncbi:hypothetical protein HOT32_gp31 [Erwinia phage Faunus]|uniref:Uncharacterized protein n=1 Tax=Erwinia phage Faunus TaxID=2182346 RepID=A0A2U8UWW6_9CAUD|nr:hypothetical protein HOT32_gp31 [Erwinia phage Faunus]AWN08614.1 hypothetical protein [Erwinia phage Faunus]